MLYNNVAGALNPTVAGTPADHDPGRRHHGPQGATLNGLIAAGPTTLTWTGNYVSYPFGTGGLISGFSSFGLNAELLLKPNIGAPGGGIFSSYPLELGGTATLSGTSMSSPHVAGGVALILEARPNIVRGRMMARLQNSADPKNWSGNPGLGFLDHAFRQGAGMLDIVGTVAVDDAGRAEPDFARRERGRARRPYTLTVSNDATSAASRTTSAARAGRCSGPEHA